MNLAENIWTTMKEILLYMYSQNFSKNNNKNPDDVLQNNSNIIGKCIHREDMHGCIYFGYNVLPMSFPLFMLWVCIKFWPFLAQFVSFQGKFWGCLSSLSTSKFTLDTSPIKLKLCGLFWDLGWPHQLHDDLLVAGSVSLGVVPSFLELDGSGH